MQAWLIIVKPQKELNKDLNKSVLSLCAGWALDRYEEERVRRAYFLGTLCNGMDV